MESAMRSIKKFIKYIFYLVLLLAIVIAVGVYYPSPKLPDVGFSDTMLIQDVNIVEIGTGTIYPQQNVLIEDGIVSNISQANIRPVDQITIIIEGTGKFLIPGLWDMHSQSTKRSPYIDHPLNIANGVTHLRDLSGCLHKNDSYWACTDDRVRWSRLAESGSQISPIYHQHTVHPLAGGDEVPNSFPDYLKSDVSEKAFGLVKYAKSQDANFLSIDKNLDRKTYFGLATEAQKNQMTLAGKIPYNASLPDALSAQQKSIDDATLFSFACYSNMRQLLNSKTANKFSTLVLEDVVAQQDRVKCSTLMTAMATSNTWWSPNLQDLKNEFAYNNSKTSKYVPLIFKYGFWKLHQKDRPSQSAISAYEALFDLSSQQILSAQQAGVKIIAGSNAAGNQLIAGESLHTELADMVNGGLTPLQALQSATLNPTVFSSQLTDYGSIQIGKKADFVLLNSNPITSINALTNIEAVITQNRYLNKDELNKLLAYSERQAKSWHQNIKIFWDYVASPIQRKAFSNASE